MTLTSLSIALKNLSKRLTPNTNNKQSSSSSETAASSKSTHKLRRYSQEFTNLQSEHKSGEEYKDDCVNSSESSTAVSRSATASRHVPTLNLTAIYNQLSAPTKPTSILNMGNCVQKEHTTSSVHSNDDNTATPQRLLRRKRRESYISNDNNQHSSMYNSAMGIANMTNDMKTLTIDDLISSHAASRCASVQATPYTSPYVSPYQTPLNSARAKRSAAGTSSRRTSTNRALIFTFDEASLTQQSSTFNEINNTEASLLVALPIELQEHIGSFLQWRDLCNLSSTCKELLELSNQRQTPLQQLPYTPLDKGDGIGCKLELQSRSDWRRAYLCREHIANKLTEVAPIPSISPLVVTPTIHAIAAEISETLSPALLREATGKQITVVLKLLHDNVNDKNCVEECLRWIVQLHDIYGDALVAPVVDKHMVEAIVTVLKRYNAIPQMVQMTAKVLGVLSTHEQNRPLIPQMHGVRHLLAAVKTHCDHVKVLSNIFWSLVIIARPLGAAEGSTFTHPHKQTTANIKHIVDEGGIEAIMGSVRRHRHSPHVLTKAYWCLVNLSIVQDHKLKVLEEGALQIILQSMRDFPGHAQLQYRAAFALINLAIRTEAKEQLREFGAIELLLDGMKRFPRYRVFQKCACVVLRSLAYGSYANLTRVVNGGGVQAIAHLMTRWRGVYEFPRLGSTTLECLEVPHHVQERIFQRIELLDNSTADDKDVQMVLRREEHIGEYMLPPIVDMDLPDDDELEQALNDAQIDAEEQHSRTMGTRVG